MIRAIPVGRAMRALAAGILLAGLASGASAQQGVWTSIFGGGLPSPSASQQRPVDDRGTDDGEPAAGTAANIKGLAKNPSTDPAMERVRRKRDAEAAMAVRRRAVLPGQKLTSVGRPSARLNPHLGDLPPARLLAGARLGGGYNYPSPEAMTIDPRDLLEYKTRAIDDPRSTFPSPR